MMEVVRQAMAALPPNQGAVVALRDVEGLDSGEVCNALNISETNQRVLLHRGRSKVRAALERYLADADHFGMRALTELVTDYLEGRLALRDRLRFRMHLATCRHCRAYIKQVRTLPTRAAVVSEGGHGDRAHRAEWGGSGTDPRPRKAPGSDSGPSGNFPPLMLPSPSVNSEGRVDAAGRAGPAARLSQRRGPAQRTRYFDAVWLVVVTKLL